jgi:hypothetical protein
MELPGKENGKKAPPIRLFHHPDRQQNIGKAAGFARGNGQTGIGRFGFIVKVEAL